MQQTGTFNQLTVATLEDEDDASSRVGVMGMHAELLEQIQPCGDTQHASGGSQPTSVRRLKTSGKQFLPLSIENSPEPPEARPWTGDRGSRDWMTGNPWLTGKP